VQVEPMKPMLKAPGTKHLTPKYDKLLANVAFKAVQVDSIKTRVESTYSYGFSA